MVAENGYIKFDFDLEDKYNCVMLVPRGLATHREAHEELTMFRLAIRRLL